MLPQLVNGNQALLYERELELWRHRQQGSPVLLQEDHACYVYHTTTFTFYIQTQQKKYHEQQRQEQHHQQQ